MFYTGRLIDIDCDIKSFFICEHEVDHFRHAGSSYTDLEQPILVPYVGGGV